MYLPLLILITGFIQCSGDLKCSIWPVACSGSICETLYHEPISGFRVIDSDFIISCYNNFPRKVGWLDTTCNNVTTTNFRLVIFKKLKFDDSISCIWIWQPMI